MDDLAAFLDARLDEDEAAAQAARGVGAEWYLACDDVAAVEDLRQYIARHDPARALRDIEADRAILALLEQDVTDGRERDYEATEVLEQVARFRAARFRDHPDYRPEWKP